MSERIVDVSDSPILKIVLPGGDIKEFPVDTFMMECDKNNLVIRNGDESSYTKITEVVSKIVNRELGPLAAFKIYVAACELVAEAQKKTGWLQSFATTTQESADSTK